MSTIELKDIDTTIAYEGYLWMSNADRAVEYHYDRPLDTALLDSVNPFVKEVTSTAGRRGSRSASSTSTDAIW